jgi:hypothetical protein
MKVYNHFFIKAILLVFWFVVLSCDRPSNFEGGVSEMALAKIPETSSSAVDEPGQQLTDADRMLIRTGYLELEMEDVVKSKSEIEKIFREYHAYVSSETHRII